MSLPHNLMYPSPSDPLVPTARTRLTTRQQCRKSWTVLVSGNSRWILPVLLLLLQRRRRPRLRQTHATTTKKTAVEAEAEASRTRSPREKHRFASPRLLTAVGAAGRRCRHLHFVPHRRNLEPEPLVPRRRNLEPEPQPEPLVPRR